MDKIAILREIVEQKQARKVVVKDGQKSRKVLIDLFSASVALKVHSLVNEANRIKLEAMPLPKMIGICMSVYAKQAA